MNLTAKNANRTAFGIMRLWRSGKQRFPYPVGFGLFGAAYDEGKRFVTVVEIPARHRRAERGKSRRCVSNQKG
jgi:hypothetical protein